VCINDERPDIPQDMPQCLKEFLELGWNKKPTKRPTFSSIIDMMDEITLNCTLIYNNAIMFWLNYWKGKTETKFSDFAEELYYSVYLPLPETTMSDYKYLSLLAIVCDQMDENAIVNLEKFSLVLKWFGDLKTESNIIDNIYNIVQHPWFHGFITREEATDILTKKKRKPGSFLVRLSTSEPIESNPFTLSKLTKDGKVVHQRIYKLVEDNKELFSITVPDTEEKISADNLSKLIDIAIDKLKLKAGSIPRKKFGDIFKEKNDEDHDEGYIEEMKYNYNN